MEQAAVIEDAHGRHQRRTNQNPRNLRPGGSMKRQQDGNHDSSVHGQPA